MSKPRLLSGIRPTGSLHLGHLAGALTLWRTLQDSGNYQCFFLLADAQALTDHAEEAAKIKETIFAIALDWLSIGLDPSKSNFVVQSLLPETFELEHYLASLTPQAWVEDNPTLKDEIRQLRERRSSTLTSAFVRYPVSQAADILLPKANLVPVGEDQLPHIELAREIARRFNQIYGEVFPLPSPLTDKVRRLIGLEGPEKMSKSLGNVILLTDSAEMVGKKVMGMFTDPKRIHANIPGTVEGNPVFIYHDAFNPDLAEVDELKKRYQNGQIRDVEVKERLIAVLENLLSPIRQRRSEFTAQPNWRNQIEEFLQEGTRIERKIAVRTLIEVKQAMGIDYLKNDQSNGSS